MRYTKAERETAAMICAIAASNQSEWFSSIELSLGCWPIEAHDLAVSAYCEARNRHPHLRIPNPIIDAEAEAMIRNGEI